MLNTKLKVKLKSCAQANSPQMCDCCLNRDINDFTGQWFCKRGYDYIPYGINNCPEFRDECPEPPFEPIPEPEPGPFGPVPRPGYTEEDEMVDKLIDALTNLKVYCVKKNGSDGGWCPWDCPWNIRTSTTGSCKWIHTLENFDGCPNDWPIENIKKGLNR